MELVSIVSVAARVGLAAATPVVLYFGGGIAAAALVSMLFAILTFVATLLIAGRLQPYLWGTSFERTMFRPIVKFGGGLVLAALAGVLLVNFEKLALSRLVSVEALAYYSVAFTFAGMATMFSMAMIQSLVPAFSQLLAKETNEEFRLLFHRVMRLNIIAFLPILALLFVVAKPFFTLWAGEDFGRESTVPFYILLGGLFFNLLAYVPHGAITASGRSDVHARLYWSELVPFILITLFLVSSFGILGAALAWSLRVVIDAAIYIWLAKRVTGIDIDLTRVASDIALSVGFLILPIFVALKAETYSPIPFLLLILCGSGYCWFVWRKQISNDERHWARNWLVGRLRMAKLD
jgi:O-antigen/teichoic acid export membrane protein